jgi:hypothetical protein
VTAVRRRRLLRSAAALAGVAVAGCSNGGDGGSDGDGDGAPRTLNVEALDVSPDGAVTSLTVEYAYRTQDILRYDRGVRESSGEITYLVFQLRVTNDGEQALRIGPDAFQTADPDEEGVYNQFSFEDPDAFPQRRLDPGDVATGWAVFAVPTFQDLVLLALNQDQLSAPAAVTFSETDLEFTVDDDATRTPVPDEPTGTPTAAPTTGTATATE